MVVNASDSVQTTEVTYPESYGEDFRQLSALRSKSYVPYLNNSEEMLSGELLTLQPFSYRVLTFEELKERKKKVMTKHRLIVWKMTALRRRITRSE